MKRSSIFSLLITVCVLGSTANAAQSSKACDRECLRGKVSELLYAFAKHDVSKVAVAPTLRVTEDAIVKPLADVGLVKSVTALAGYRQDIIDERMGIVWLRMAWGTRDLLPPPHAEDITLSPCKRVKPREKREGE